MLSFPERVDLLRKDLLKDPPAFVLSRELPFAIFRYDPSREDESEWIVRKQVALLATQIQNQTQQPVAIRSLAEQFWRSIRESEEIQALFQLERDFSFSVAERQVNLYLSDAAFRPLCRLLVEEEQGLDRNTRALFLIHATVFAPAAYRVSALLEQLHLKLRTPTVLFYPGSWSHNLNYMNLRSDDQLLGSYRVKIYGRDS